ncbi:MAG: hypothetical protein M0017_02065 [Desulfobacteraceae bacterium]|nr:hypothetical protein [Desulfobacteraceae bacterium]
MVSPSAREVGRTVRKNCDISDAVHCGIYSVCTLVLKLRQLFKWQHGLEPWQEPEPKEVLAWIDKKENGWETVQNEEFAPLPVNGGAVDPFAVEIVNRELRGTGLSYGAGYGRSLKPVFFLAEIVAEREMAGHPVTILGRELARELASPFAMAQDERIIIRRDPLRFFLYDQIREIRRSGQEALGYSLRRYGIAGEDGRPDPALLIERLDAIVEGELGLFLHHELGEMRISPADRELTRKLALFFAGSAIEFAARAVQDLVADTDGQGTLGYVLRERKETSLGFYVAFLDPLRETLFPEIRPAARRFFRTGDWDPVREAVAAGRRRNLARSAVIREICRDLAEENRERLAADLEEELLRPLGLGKAQPAPRPGEDRPE